MLPQGLCAQDGGRRYLPSGLTPIPRTAVHWVALFEELARNAFIEGLNTTIIGYGMAPDRLEEGAAELVKAGVDAILTGGSGPTSAAQRATTTIPILTALDDFIGLSFATSLVRPGGNITGVSVMGSELDSKRLEILMEMVPTARRIAVLANPASTPPFVFDALQRSAAGGVELSIHRAARQGEIASALDGAMAARAEAVNVLASQLFNVNRAEILGRIAQTKLPAMYQWPEWTEEGALAAYGPRFTTVYRSVGRQLVEVLRGAKPADIPIEQPDRFELAVNLRAAKAIGLVIPPAFLLNPDTIID
jgi:putative ABC transport system substrate-binding protein